jgi:hypothetical protein
LFTILVLIQLAILMLFSIDLIGLSGFILD